MLMTPEWLLLVFFLPAQRAGARVQAWRRLQRVGAVLLKNSAYVLPHTPESREDFEWIRNEIQTSGGEAAILAATTLDPAAHENVVQAFRAARGKDFNALSIAATKLLKDTSRRNAEGARRQLTQGARRLRERFEETVRLDFLGSPERDEVAALLTRIDQRLGRTRPMAATSKTPSPREYQGRQWLTRTKPGVDRMSSAWLIRRFIDRNATFVFDDPKRSPNAIPFDTFEAEFGHHGTHCTFETLCDRFTITDLAVLRIGRIVHDLDLKDDAYGEAETPTIGRLVEGLRRAHHDDDALLRAGMEVFEALYQSAAVAPTSSHPTNRAKQRPRRTKRARK